MSSDTGDNASWEEKEIGRLNQMIEMEEDGIREQWCVSNSIVRPRSPRNFLSSPALSQEFQNHSLVAGTSESPNSTAAADSSRLPEVFKKWRENIVWRRRFNFVALQNYLEQDLDGTEGNHGEKCTDGRERTEELGGNDQESELNAAFLDDSDEEDGDLEYYDCLEPMSDDDCFFYDTLLQEDMLDHDNNPVEKAKDNEPFFGDHLFNNPLRALEDQESDSESHPPKPIKPAKPHPKSFSLSKTPIKRFLAKKIKSKRRKSVPNGPGQFVGAAGDQILVLIVNGINTTGVPPTRGEIELWRHGRYRKFGQYVSFSSPLRHCWSYYQGDERR
ncbi:hypothetical protein OCU04_001243 [Sclerotinia nivalis]|uniref:Uncharacterized protein n=1 Tax=Sclerotinia nivalis TaxID=352851 RepID=A0A9X0AYC3_9HELO|nr:hypothetical protein OCU04_001243 [Sclerotinia nivalis]